MTPVQPDESLGLGFAAKLLQVNLGVGLALVAVSASAGRAIAHGSKPAGPSLPWEVALKATAVAAGPAPLIAAFALLQAYGSSPDLLTWFGLLACTIAVVLGCAFTCVRVLHSGEGEDARSIRIISSLRVCGQVMLVFGKVPGGTQLGCASLLARAALLVNAATTGARAMALRSGAACSAMERSLSVAPVIVGLALLDQTVWGPSSTLLHPSLLHTAFCLAQAALMALAIGERAPPLEPLRWATGVGMQASMVLGTIRVLTGIFTVQITTASFEVSWGEPLAAGAAKLTALSVGISAADFVCSRLPPAPSNGLTHGTGSSNGITSTNGSGEHVTHGTLLQTLKAIAAPADTLALALMASRMARDTSPGVGPLDAMLAALPLKFGLLVAAGGLGLQLVLPLIFMCYSSEADMSEMHFDGAGTLKWEEVPMLRGAAVTFLQLGLLSGWAGLGVTLWILLGLSVGPVVAVVLPPEFRARLGDAALQSMSGLLGIMSGILGRLDAIMEQRCKAQEEMSARVASLKAQQLEAEVAASRPARKSESQSAPGGKAGPVGSKPKAKGKKK